MGLVFKKAFTLVLKFTIKEPVCRVFMLTNR
jgi:hypothetical protein